MIISKNIIKLTVPWILFGTCVFTICSCNKQDDFLNVKSNKSDVTPTTLQDFQAVLDNTDYMNSLNSIIGLLGTDNVYVPDVNLKSANAYSRNAYLWAKDVFASGPSYDWNYLYQTVAYANIVLDGLNRLSPLPNDQTASNVKGSALFYRSFAFYQLSQIFCKPYDVASSATDPGIPLRLTSDVNTKSTRATVQQTYEQIIADLKTAANLLPVSPLYKTRPCSIAANALLAKVYLAMGDYVNAFAYADRVLKHYNTLLDYNSVNIGAAYPFPPLSSNNPEIIYYAYTAGNTLVWNSASVKGRVSPALYQAYDPADLRKKAFYNPDGSTGYYKFKGSYSGLVYNFCGIATDEIYLIRAECLARSNDLAASLSDLNTLLQKRYTPSSFSPFVAADQTSVLNKIILERRKEMPFTGNSRWEDLRRLNTDTRFAVTLTRTSNGVQYILMPGDNRFVYPIPDNVIQLDGLQQNPR